MKSRRARSRFLEKQSGKKPLTRRGLTLGASLLVALVFAGLPTLRRADFSRQVSAQQGITPSAIGILFTVNSTGDGNNVVTGLGLCADSNGKCTLRAAIQEANAQPTDDTIDFNIPKTDPGYNNGYWTITLTTALPNLGTNINIQGPGAALLNIEERFDASPTFRIFNVTATGTVTISGAFIQGGSVPGDLGGGIQNFSTATVNVTNCVLLRDHANLGGGIANVSSGTVNVTNSGFEECSSAANGGAIFNNNTGTVNVTNSTLSFNSASSGGGIFNNGAGTVNVSNTTVLRNLAATNVGGLLNNSSGTLKVKSTIVALNRASSSGPDVGGTFNSQGFNLIGKKDGSTGFTGATDLTGTVASPLDPKLNPDATLLGDSPAIDQGTSITLAGTTLTTDQRGTGFPRKFDDPAIANAVGGDGTDIGAFERQLSLTLMVNSTGDADDVSSGDRLCDSDAVTAGQQCTLRAAITESNAYGANTTVNFAIPTTDPGFDSAAGKYTINLTRTLPSLRDDILINGPGADVLTVRRNSGGDYGIFVVDSPATISGLTISNGGADGGGILIPASNSATVNVINCTISNNSTVHVGGGIGIEGNGAVNITNSTISNNSTGATGGGIFASSTSGTVNITNSTISGNSAGSGGGGIDTQGTVTVNVTNTLVTGNFTFGVAVASYVGGGGIQDDGGSTVNITNSTISNNSVGINATSSESGKGGGIFNSNGNVNVTNSTLSGNSANGNPGSGGAIFNAFSPATMNVSNCTLSRNSASIGGGIYLNGGTVNVKSSIIALNTTSSSSPDVIGSFTSQGYNLIGKGDTSTGFTAATDLTGTIASPLDPKLDPNGLQNNGGPTQTIALLFGSPAIDKGINNPLAVLSSVIQNSTTAIDVSDASNIPAGVGFTILIDSEQMVVISKSGNSLTVTRGANSTTAASHSAGASLYRAFDQRGTGFPRTFNDPNVPNASGGDGTDIGAFEVQTITPTLQFSSAAYSVNENAGTATITVTRTGDTSAVTTGVNYATSGGAATAGSDYTATSGTLVFARGDTSKTFSIPIINDSLNEPNETINLTLSNVTGNAVLGTPIAAVLTIIDDDPLPGLSINDVSVAEGNSGTTNANFTVSLSAASGQTVTVNYATANGTATAGSDYVATSGTLIFTPGQTSKTIPVTVNGDTTVEPDETYFVDLSSPANAAITRSRGTGTILNDDGPTIQFSASNYPVGEGAGRLDLTVTRSGSTSGAASVGFTTSDTAGALNCNVVGGVASSRCDYETSIATLKFAAGETSKTISVFIVDDSYLEGTETFTASLSNPTGAALGLPLTATVTITDNEIANGVNPIDAAGFFVRLHYLDFLNREPDSSGLAFWTNEITSCGSDQACIALKRINVSAAFYLSIEFQETGYLVERIYKASYGDATGLSTLGGAHQLSVPVVRLSEFLPDTQEIGQGVVVRQGNWQQQLEDNKNAFTTGFVQRSRFTSAFPASMTPAQFVDALNANSGGALSPAERNQLVSDLTTNTKTRAQVLRAVAEDPDLNNAEFNRAFVLMQFFGYLRRNPNDPQDSDYTGYDFWLGKLNQFNGNFVNAEMVKAFISSGEYRQRFGP